MTRLNFTVDNHWRTTFNKFFQQLRRVDFITRTPEDALNLEEGITGVLPIENGGTGQALIDGWFPLSSEGTYVSATSFTVPGSHLASLTLGLKLKFTNNSTVKYGYFLSGSENGTSTTINIIPTTSYQLASGGISDVYIGVGVPAKSFPAMFQYTPASVTGFTVTPSDSELIMQFNIDGNNAHVFGAMPTALTGSGGSLTISSPLTANSVSGGNMHYNGPIMYWENNGGTGTVPGRANLQAGGSVINLYTTIGGGGWTNGTGRRVYFNISFPINR